MRVVVALLAFVAGLSGTLDAHAQSGAANAKQAVDLIVLMCVAGGEKVEIVGNVKVEGGLSLRRPGLSGAGELKISSTEAKGLVEGLTASMNKMSADQASEARKCMQPFISQVLAMLPKGEVVAPAPLRPANCRDNNSYQCAAQLGFGESESGEFGRGDKFYRFETSEPSRVRITLNPMPNSRFVIVRLVSQEYATIGSRQFNAGQPGSLQATVRSAGTYFIVLEPGSCCSGAPYTYTVSLSRL